MVIVRSNEQLLDWLSAGKYAFGIGARQVDTAMTQGLPLNQFLPWITERRIVGDRVQWYFELIQPRASP